MVLSTNISIRCYKSPISMFKIPIDIHAVMLKNQHLGPIHVMPKPTFGAQLITRRQFCPLNSPTGLRTVQFSFVMSRMCKCSSFIYLASDDAVSPLAAAAFARLPSRRRTVGRASLRRRGRGCCRTTWGRSDAGDGRRRAEEG
jgi:hypothetical protein